MQPTNKLLKPTNNLGNLMIWYFDWLYGFLTPFLVVRIFFFFFFPKTGPQRVLVQADKYIWGICVGPWGRVA